MTYRKIGGLHHFRLWRFGFTWYTARPKPFMPKVPAQIMCEARRLARQAIKTALREKGEKVSHYRPKDITEAASQYLAEHRELIEQARANVNTILPTIHLSVVK